MASEQFADGGVDNVLAIERIEVVIGSIGACNAAVLVRGYNVANKGVEMYLRAHR